MLFIASMGDQKKDSTREEEEKRVKEEVVEVPKASHAVMSVGADQEIFSCVLMKMAGEVDCYG